MLSLGNLIEKISSLGGLFSWLPSPLNTLCGLAITVLFIWFLVGLIRNIVGTFL